MGQKSDITFIEIVDQAPVKNRQKSLGKKEKTVLREEQQDCGNRLTAEKSSQLKNRQEEA